MFMNFVKRYVVFISYIEYIYIIKCQKDILVDFTKKKIYSYKFNLCLLCKI